MAHTAIVPAATIIVMHGITHRSITTIAIATNITTIVTTITIATIAIVIVIYINIAPLPTTTTPTISASLLEIKRWKEGKRWEKILKSD